MTEFQDVVFNKVELSGEDGIMVPEIRVPHSSVNKRTQRDMETLATLFCGSYTESQLSKWMMSLSLKM